MLIDLHTHVNAPEHLVGTKFMEDCIRGGGSYAGMIWHHHAYAAVG